MNTSALKSFAQDARTLLREGVERRLIYWGFDKKGNNNDKVEAVAGGYTFRGKVSDDTTVPAIWNKLKAAIANTSFDEVVEKASYTWFNRLLAMKILSKNGYETAQLDYLTEETQTPAILERARRGQYPFLNTVEKKRLELVLTDYEKEQEAFAILLIGFCHQHALLQGIFGSIDDFSELLLPDDILTENGFLYYLNTSEAISDEDYKQVELIGWLYQFYISEKKDEVFAGFKKKKKAEAKDIPAATQIFTPNWIVKYLVQNTLGRTWLDAHPDSELKKDWKYLVEPSSADKLPAKSDEKISTPDFLTFLDPAVGSGHILVEAFDTLYPMYMAEYYSPEEAVQSILEKNLFGLDLDLRATQLAQFAVLLKAAQYSRIVLEGKILPHVYSMPQQRSFSKEEVTLFLGKENDEYTNQLYKALQIMKQADNLGSIMVLELSKEARKAVEDRSQYWQEKTSTSFEDEIIKEIFPVYIPILVILTGKFACIAANPPYMGKKNMNESLREYVNEHYQNSSADLYSVFMEVSFRLLRDKSRYAMINQHSWMFLDSFKDLRKDLITDSWIESILHLGPKTFDEIAGEVVQSVCFVINKSVDIENQIFCFDVIEGDNSNSKEKRFLSIKESKGKCNFLIKQTAFLKTPNFSIAYWISQTLLEVFKNANCLSEIGLSRRGLQTGDVEKYIHNWHEVLPKEIFLQNRKPSELDFSKYKWYLLNSGGRYRKWYGNLDYVVIWHMNGSAIKANPKAIIPNEQLYFKEAITWSKVSTRTNFRLQNAGVLPGDAGPCLYVDDSLKSYLGLLNSNVNTELLRVINPTLGMQSGSISVIPVLLKEIQANNAEIEAVVEKCISVSVDDWNSREVSSDFQYNALIKICQENLEYSFRHWVEHVTESFFQLHSNEEELNRVFIKIYGLQNELTPEVLLKDITILQDELDYDALEQLQKPYVGQLVPVKADVVMQQLISYAVACYMGRYRLDKPGLHIAHPNPAEDELVPYSVKSGEDKHFLFQIDDDAIIPLMGSNGNFTDDMLPKVKEFLTIVWGDDTLTANLNFLQQQLGKDLEDYLVKDFWKYHTKTYSKKPIYWLFASKKGAFQVLVYMHRMNAYTPAKIRSKYLIPHISWLNNLLRDMEKNVASLSRTELKKLDTYRKQLAECEEYDLLLKDLADKQISFDLDDGVTRNYELFEGVVAAIK